VGWIDQPVPFHTSARVTSAPALSVKYPTEVHTVAVAQDTLSKKLPVVPVGFGVVCTVQLVPSHCSARVTSAPALSVKNPTAVHVVAIVQDTLARAVLVAPGGLGVACVVQLEPSHCSASGAFVPALFAVYPTAVHAVDVGQDTLSK
jgi:hypothetical protein